MKKTILLWGFLCWVLLLQAQAPAGYYNAASGKSGAGLKTALFNIVTNHTVRSYSDLWEDFRKTDMRADGKVWDMYSDMTNYTFGKEQGLNYKGEGDAYNREHSFPKSWFNDAKPMYTDLFHLYPTDGYVNNRRSNYPFGEVKNTTWTSHGDFCKLGSSAVPGYSGTVFEPADEYKGDFARTYFYMATCYEDKIASWSSPMLAGNKYPAYSSWAVTMLLRWAAEDPVSQKEIDRNNAVYRIQKNRNPYIDYPGLERYVWGDRKTTPFNPDDYESGGGTTPDPEVEAALPVFSPASGQVERGTEVSISCATPGAYIYYKVNDGEEQVAYPPVKIKVETTMTIKAYALLGENRSEEVTATYTLPGSALQGENLFILLTDEADLKEGTHCLIVCESKDVAMSARKDDVRSYAEVTVTDGEITTPVNVANAPYALVLGGRPGAWTFYDAVENNFLALTTDGNKLHSASSTTEQTAQWNITISSDATAQIANLNYPNRSIRYNASSPRFACYKTGQQPVALYALSTVTGIVEAIGGTCHTTVCDLNGRVLRRNVPTADAVRGLPAGIYIVGGVKVLVR